MYTRHTLFLYFSDFSNLFIYYFFYENKINKTEKQPNKNMLNKAQHKTKCKCMRREERRRRSSHGDNTNVLMNEFEAFTLKKFGKQVNLLIIGVNKLKSESTIFDKLPNEVMSNSYVFSSKMLNRILRDVNNTGIVTIDSEMLLTSTIIMEEFLYP